MRSLTPAIKTEMFPPKGQYYTKSAGSNYPRLYSNSVPPLKLTVGAKSLEFLQGSGPAQVTQKGQK